MIALIDIDGTIANTSHRDQYITGKTKDYKKFQARAIHDRPIPNAIALVKALSKYLDIVYLTGRNETIRDETAEWLKLNGCPRGKLVMRDTLDFRPAAEFKKAMVQQQIGTDKIAMALDDDLTVRSMYEGLGIKTIPVKKNG